MKISLTDKSFTIIGSNSYIARHIVYFLNRLGCTIYLYDKDIATSDILQPYSQINIVDINSLIKINFDVDFIMVFSGLTGTSAGFELFDSFIDVNEKGLLNILNGIREKKSKARVIFLSTRLVYKGKKNQKLKETDEIDLKTIYAVNKFSCENFLKIYNDCFNIPYSIFRICVPYGSMFGKTLSYGTLGYFMNTASIDNDTSLFGDGSQKRSLIHIGDLAEIIIEALYHDASKNEIFNVGGPDVLSIRQIAKSIARLYGVNVRHKKWSKLDKQIESGDTIFNSGKIEKLTGYNYKYTFEKWLKEFKK